MSLCPAPTTGCRCTPARHGGGPRTSSAKWGSRVNGATTAQACSARAPSQRWRSASPIYWRAGAARADGVQLPATLTVIDFATPRTGFLATPLNEPLELFDAALHLAREQPERIAYVLDEALRVVSHREPHDRALVAGRFKPDRAGIRRTRGALPRDPCVGLLFGDLRIPLLFLAPHYGTPMEMRVVYLAHFLDAVHEQGKFLELRPLVVNRIYRSIDLDEFFDAFHVSSSRIG